MAHRTAARRITPPATQSATRPATLLGALLALATVATSAGCPYVADGEIRVAEGSTVIGPGSVVKLLLYCDRLFAGWEIAAGGSHCAGTWAVGAPLCLEGCPPPDGTAGTISECGVYTAPAERPPEPPTVAATECSSFYCADACGASLTLDLAGYDAP